MNLKLVSCNVLAEDFYDKYFKDDKRQMLPVTKRANAFNTLFKSLDPDIICLQEYDNNVCSNFFTSGTYDIKHRYNKNDSHLVIAYKKTLTPIKPANPYFYPEEETTSCHGFMLIVLEEKSGKKLGIANAHLEGGGGATKKELENKSEEEKAKFYYDFRIKQLKQIETKIKEYKDIDSWIICGDFNLNISDVKIGNKDGYSYIRNNVLKESDGWKDADETHVTKTAVGISKEQKQEPQRLDYIFYKGTLTKPVYKVKIDPKKLLKHTKDDKDNTESFSDHSPITATWDDLSTALSLLKAKLLSLVKALT